MHLSSTCACLLARMRPLPPSVHTPLPKSFQVPHHSPPHSSPSPMLVPCLYVPPVLIVHAFYPCVPPNSYVPTHVRLPYPCAATCAPPFPLMCAHPCAPSYTCFSYQCVPSHSCASTCAPPSTRVRPPLLHPPPPPLSVWSTHVPIPPYPCVPPCLYAPKFPLLKSFQFPHHSSPLHPCAPCGICMRPRASIRAHLGAVRVLYGFVCILSRSMRIPYGSMRTPLRFVCAPLRYVHALLKYVQASLRPVRAFLSLVRTPSFLLSPIHAFLVVCGHLDFTCVHPHPHVHAIL
jgi:hypothetical protein